MASLLALMVASPAWAQSGMSPNSAASGTRSAHTTQDVRFVMAASAAGDTEIMASRLAQKQAQSANVKTFAATMIHDHTMANEQLKAIAQKDGYSIASMPTETQEANLAKLRPLHGADFDKAYATMMVSDHRDAVALFQSESNSGNNADLKAFATQTLPILQHHLSMATSL
ncbi:DUF4142 domain-containing protein [Dyella jejuensis]|uniref:DUF4142 domain-containing protein n=1 Tax=Dyella jejuensis TaxID=1432009 RepID=A0ABW8JMY9_9GAMM